MKKDGRLVDNIPNGYEIYENPNGQVFLRKLQPKLITDEEIGLVKEGIKKYSPDKNCKIDVKKNVLFVYAPDQDIKELSAILSIFPSSKSSAENEQLLSTFISYSPVFQFVLIDSKRRIFRTQRYCYLGSKEGWIEIGQEDILSSHCKRYLKHIGKDSYFELDM